MQKLFPKPDPNFKQDEYPVNDLFFTLLTARYPDELKSIYRSALNHEWQVDTKEIAQAIVEAPFDKRTKRELLELGLTHTNHRHRYAAELALAVLDNEEFSKRLLKRIEQIPIANAADPDKPIEIRLPVLCDRSNDHLVWPALNRAIQRHTAGLRFLLLHQLLHDPEQPHRREKIRILAGFLDDRTVRTKDECLLQIDQYNSMEEKHNSYELRK